MAKVKGDSLGVCNPFPGCTIPCIYEKQPGGAIKPIIWLTKPKSTSKEDFDELISQLSFRVMSAKDKQDEAAEKAELEKEYPVEQEAMSDL